MDLKLEVGPHRKLTLPIQMAAVFVEMEDTTAAFRRTYVTKPRAENAMIIVSYGRFPVLEQAEDSLPRRTTIGAWVDLQLCSLPRRRKRKPSMTGNPQGNSSNDGSSSSSRNSRSATRASSGSSGNSRRLAATRSSTKKTRTKRKSGAITNPSAREEDRGDDSTRAVIPGRNGGDDVPKEGDAKGAAVASAAASAPAEAAEVEAVTSTTFVLVDVEGTQSRGRGGAEGMEFDSRCVDG